MIGYLSLQVNVSKKAQSEAMQVTPGDRCTMPPLQHSRKHLALP